MKRVTSIALSFEKTDFGPVLFGGDLEGGIRLISELGFPAVEISIRDPGLVDRRWLHRLLSETGISISGIATGQAYYNDGLSLTDLKPERRRVCFDRLKHQVDLVAEFGGCLIVGGIRGVLSRDPGEREMQEEAFYSGFRELADFARKVGVTIALEPINRYETNMINTVSEGLDALARLGCDNVGLLVDTFHMNIEEPRIADSIRRAGRAVVYVHIADSNRWAPGFGHTDFGEVLAALDEIGYEGPISAEILPCPTAEEAAMAVARFWKERSTGGARRT
ncbi:MAG TPA: sugar phosphate isomerase/epimerase [Firmicutes bacterium]|nr:sugar phosphate isomerase/epimerase [Bacillota bacterium]